jgi:hypothetical protein
VTNNYEQDITVTTPSPVPGFYTWADIVDTVNEVYSREGGRPNASHWLRLGNQAVRELSRRAGMVTPVLYQGWDSAGVDQWGRSNYLTLTNGMVMRPRQTVRINAVMWNKIPLTKVDRDYLDAHRPQWRTAGATQAPNSWTLEGVFIRFEAPLASASGLSMEATTYLPDFSYGETAGSSPLAFLPLEYQLAPADYILYMLPAIGAPGSPEYTAGMARRQEYAAAWKADIGEAVKSTKTMADVPFTY